MMIEIECLMLKRQCNLMIKIHETRFGRIVLTLTSLQILVTAMVTVTLCSNSIGLMIILPHLLNNFVSRPTLTILDTQ